MRELPSDVVLWVASNGPETAACGPRSPVILGQWLGRITEHEKIDRMRRPRSSAPRRSAASRSAWSCSRPWRPGTVVASDIPGYRPWPATASTRC